MENFESLLEAIKELTKTQKPVLIAIDGPSGSGKTTLADRILSAFPSSAVVHTDDFFLQPHQRTPQRLNEPGGNMDRERLVREALSVPTQEEGFTYHKYDCQSGEMIPVQVSGAKVLIIEGSYSLHPDLASFYDLKVYISVDKEEQLRRLEKRVGKERLSRFINEWIPLENRYFDAFSIKDRADIRLKG